MQYSYPVRYHMLTILPLCAVLLGITAFIGTSDAVVPFFRAYRPAHPTLTFAMQILTDWGNPALYIAYAALFWRGRKHHDRRLTRFVIVYILVQLAMAFLLVRVLKIAIGRPRPGVEGLYQPWSFGSAHNSLPSGHTAEIVGATVPLTFFSRTMVLPLILGCYTALVGFSRVYLEMHHTSDVFFGILVGSVAAYAIHTFWNRD